MVHLQDAAPTCRAVVCSVGLPRLTFLAIPQLSIRLYSEGRRARPALRRQRAVLALPARRASGIGEDGSRIAPVEHQVEEHAEDGRFGP